MLGHALPSSNLQGKQCPTPGEPWPASRLSDHRPPTDALPGRHQISAARAHFLEASTDRRKPAGWSIEWCAVVSALARLDCGGKQGCDALLFRAPGEPPHKGLVTGVAALAKFFKFRQARLLGCWDSAHGFPLRADGPCELITQ